jgi:hypothetical protein
MVCYGAINKNTNRKPQANCMDLKKKTFRETYGANHKLGVTIARKVLPFWHMN